MVTHDDVSLPRSRPSTTTRDIDEYIYICLGTARTTLFVFCCVVAVLVVVLVILAGNIPISDSNIPNLDINSIRVTNFNLSNPISAHWNINMSFHSNDSSFMFSDSAILIFHESKEEALWKINLKQFDMRPKNSSVHLALDFWESSAVVDDATVRAIGDKITNNYGVVKFYLQFEAHKPKFRFKSRIQKLWGYGTNLDMEINCDVNLLFGSLDKTRADMFTIDPQACK